MDVQTKPGAARYACDLLVIGSGVSGHCAAIQAARLGSSTILVEKDAVLGVGITGADRYNAYNRVQCLDAKTGRKMWETPLLAFRMASLTVADGKPIIMEENGMLNVAEATPSAYKEMARRDVLGGENKPKQFWVPPVLCGGRTYCRNYIGDLVCIDVSE